MKNRKALYATLISGLLLCLAIYFSCNQQKTNQKITIGVVIPQTGTAAYIGESVQKGIETAYANEPPNKARAVFQFEDSQGDPARGISAFRKLTEIQGSKVVIAALTNVSGALAPIADSTDVLLLTTAVSARDFPKVGTNVLRLFITADVDAAVAARFAHGYLHAKNPGVLFVDDDFGRSFTDVFQETFTAVANTKGVSASFPRDTRDFRQVLLPLVRGTDVDLLYVLAYNDNQGVAIRQARELGFSGPIMTIATISTPAVLEAAGPAADGVYYTSTLFDPKEEQGASAGFVRAYEQQFGDQPDYFAAFAYDLANLILETVRSDATTSEQMRDYLLSREWAGVMGTITFDQNGDCRFPMVVKSIISGAPGPTVWSPEE